MIYTDAQIVKKIREMVKYPEDEVVEFKEAKSNYPFKEMGQYFSALSNEANIRSKEEAWLVFGISNAGDYVDTKYRSDGALQHLKKEMASHVNERTTFREIYEVLINR